jgi:hypothetical protein
MAHILIARKGGERVEKYRRGDPYVQTPQSPKEVEPKCFKMYQSKRLRDRLYLSYIVLLRSRFPVTVFEGGAGH